MTVALADEPDDHQELPGALRPGLYLVPESGCPPEYADRPIREVLARIDAERQEHADVQEGPPPARPGSGFESGGPLDTSAPDGVLAELADAVTRDGGLAGVADDELIGVLRAWQRLGSWCSAGLLTAIAELARRRPANGTPSAAPGEFPARISEFVVDE